MELTQEYFDKHYQELNIFLGEQFAKVFTRFNEVATKTDLENYATKEDLRNSFAEQAVKLDFMMADLAALRRELQVLAKRTLEDDGAFSTDIIKLQN